MNNTYLNIISSEIVEAITQRCDCEYSINYIVNEHFQCSEEQSSTCVTYRARLHGSRDQEGMVLVGYVQDWINSSPDMIQTNQSDSLLSIDTNCEVVISSFNDSLCTYNNNITRGTNETVIEDEITNETASEDEITNETASEDEITRGTNETASDDSGLLQIIVIVGITAGVLCFVLIFCLVVILIYKYKKKNTMRQ